MIGYGLQENTGFVRDRPGIDAALTLPSGERGETVREGTHPELSRRIEKGDSAVASSTISPVRPGGGERRAISAVRLVGRPHGVRSFCARRYHPSVSPGLRAGLRQHGDVCSPWGTRSTFSTPATLWKPTPRWSGLEGSSPCLRALFAGQLISRAGESVAVTPKTLHLELRWTAISIPKAPGNLRRAAAPFMRSTSSSFLVFYSRLFSRCRARLLQLIDTHEYSPTVTVSTGACQAGILLDAEARRGKALDRADAVLPSRSGMPAISGRYRQPVAIVGHARPPNAECRRQRRAARAAMLFVGGPHGITFMVCPLVHRPRVPARASPGAQASCGGRGSAIDRQRSGVRRFGFVDSSRSVPASRGRDHPSSSGPVSASSPIDALLHGAAL